MANWERRLEVLKSAHQHQHKVVEALEAEKAPDQIVTQAKIKKLQLKDQIHELEKKVN